MNQTQSNSKNTGSGDGTGQSGKGNIVLSNPSSLDDGDFLMVGHDNGALTEQGTDLPTNYIGSARLAREWKVKHTGDVGTVDLTIDLTGLNFSTRTLDSFQLLLDADGDFSSGATVVLPASFSSNILTFPGISLADGTVFTLVTNTAGPGVAGANLWLKTDGDVTTSGNNVTGWTDQTGINTFSVIGTPTVVNNSVNFNSSINFTNQTDSGLPANGLIGDTEIRGVEAFGVFKYKELFVQGTILGNRLADGGFFASLLNTLQARDSNGNDQIFQNSNLSSVFSISAIDLSPTLAAAKVNGAVASVTQDNGVDFASVNLTPVIGGGANVGKLSGDLVELVVYPNSLSDVEKKKVQSYLAIKYGITLDPSVTDYVASSGTLIWNNTAYWNDVFGIGREDASGLNQSQSNSINTGSGDGTGQSGKGNIVLSNPSSLDDGDFLMIGHDNGALTEQATDLPTNYRGSARLAREWRVSHTNDLGTIDLTFNALGLTFTGTGASDFILLIDTDGDGDFSTGTVTEVAADTYASDIISFSNVTLPNNAVFTLLTYFNNSLFVTSNLWLRANDGTSQNAGNLSGWVDQTGTNTFTITGTPTFASDVVNFNPVVGFNNTTSQTVLPTHRLTGNTEISYVDAFAVFKHNSSSNTGTILGGATSGTNYGKAIFGSSRDFRVYVGDGRDGTYQSFENTDFVNAYSINNLDVSLSTSPFATARINGTTQPVTTATGGDFSNILLTPMIGGTNNNGNPFGWIPFNGNLAEVITFPAGLSPVDKLKVESYLAIKYGIHLPGSYLDGFGNLIWDATANASYHNDVFGIGSDGDSGLNQTQSNSMNTGSGDGTGQIGKGNIVLSNPSSLDPGDFLLIGHDNGAIAEQTSELPSGLTNAKRIGREWKVSHTNDVGTVNLSLDLLGISLGGNQPNNYRLLVDTDGDGDFTTGTVTEFTPDYFNGVLLFSNVSLPDNSVFTLVSSFNATLFQSPNLWLKSDQGVSTNSGKLTNWVDQSFSNNFSVVGTPAVNDSSLNFNPTVNFFQPQSNGLPDNGLLGNTQISGVEAFGVFKYENSTFEGTVVGNTAGQGGFFVGLSNSLKNQDSNGNQQAFTNLNSGTTFSISSIDLNPALADARVNGQSVTVNQDSGNDFSSIDLTPAIGGGATTGRLNGDLAELLIFPNALSESNKAIIQSYLAIKYGVSLDPSVNAYVDSDGNQIWTDTNYWNDVFGIGRDDVSGLNQIQSNSVNTGSGNGIGQSGKGNIVIINPSSLDDKAFLIIGHDNGSLLEQLSDLPAGLNMFRLGREWKVQRTMDPGTVDLEFDLNGLTTSGVTTNLNNYRLLIDNDGDGDFSTGTVQQIIPNSFVSPKLIFNGVNFPDGAIFTFVTGDPNPSWTVTKSTTTQEYNQVGDLISYEIEVENTGNVVISGVTLTDPNTTLSQTIVGDFPQPGVLDVGETWTFFATHRVTQADIDAGSYSNTATATGIPASGTLAPGISNTVTVPGPVQNPSWTLTKQASSSTFDAIGVGLSFEFVATNTGNVSISGISISDPLIPNLSQTPIQGTDTGNDGILSPGEAWRYVGAYTTTQADLDRGFIENTATISGTTTVGILADATSNTVRVTANNNPSWTVTKSTTTLEYNQVGDLISYEIEVENTGDVSITGLTLTDPNTTLSQTIVGDFAPSGILNLGETWTFFATHRVTQADIDAGSYSNTATATGIPNNGTLAPGISNTVTVRGPDPNPSWTLTKRSSSTSFSTTGFGLPYEFIATNTGNVSISGISINDPLIPNLLQTPIQGTDIGNDGILSPGEAWRYVGAYTTTQADLDRGFVENTATISGTPAGGNLADATSNTVRVTAVQNPSWTFTKTAQTLNFTNIGDVMSYNLVIENTGNVSISGVSVSDPGSTVSSTFTGDSAPLNVLDPGESWTYTAAYTITGAEISAQTYTNTATANGNSPAGAMPALQSSATVNFKAFPGGIVGSNLWLKTDDGISTLGSNLTGWTDQTGTNTFSVNGTPTVVNNSVNFNPIVNFTNSVGNGLPDNGLTGSAAITAVEAYGVFKYKDLTTQGTILGGTIADEAVFSGLFNGLKIADENGNDQFFTNPNAATAYSISSVDVSPALASAFVNGAGATVTQDLGGEFASITLDVPVIGGGNNRNKLNGDLAELVVYPVPLSVSDRN
ncbi:DUF7507 domain-containing protein [Siansivirga zeaxanthinifaciens]|uniref:DUF11 domain-containing protein n=1 Tax=Siansivirga zeaxanthinifaciens CC-SAMT-1 TaxID=1454006 RepID=A0A0C5WPA1_9FLAO|nr:hypothetical protein [Siansivirga zeaxanthinifaciens]AJR04730.1 hypothetical protein AW14_02490 [Siansivirga zeaxanthinifaciens CC-SAMT-1]